MSSSAAASSILTVRRGPRTSAEQRARLLEFMKVHEDLGRGRVTGPDAARKKNRLLCELADTLNSIGNGANKTPDKWLKCWQDWKSDVKSKALKIRKSRASTGGGPPVPPLSPLEEEVLNFFGVEMVQGLAVPDPLEIEMERDSTHELQQIPRGSLDQGAQESHQASEHQDELRPQTRSSHHRDEKLHSILTRQAAAIEELSNGIKEIAGALQLIALAISGQQIVQESRPQQD